MGEKIRAILAPVEQQVHFPGRVGLDALPGLYAAADLFVSPSHCDGSSVSLMEALALWKTGACIRYPQQPGMGYTGRGG